jgi:hypothetical protein
MLNAQRMSSALVAPSGGAVAGAVAVVVGEASRRP